MDALQIITKKRDSGELSKEEIEFFVDGFTRGQIPDYQAAAWLMAVYLQGMGARETLDLTLAMAHSGDVLDLKRVAPFVVDKHSTGGIGDKVTLVVAPLVAACGVPVGKMTGRGLGFTGGTVDKLESIPGYRTDLTKAEFKSQLKRIGIVLTGQSADLAPADRSLYALRDVTATVSSIPLIVSSIMSKKLAAGANGIVLDVKTGNGAFMDTLDSARALAEAMVRLGNDAGRSVVALISDMNQPLGWAVGNALEVQEAIAALHEAGPSDFREHCLVVAAEMLRVSGKAADADEALTLALETLASGAAWQKFHDLVEAQGGDVVTIEHPERLPRARLIEAAPAPRSGYLVGVNAAEIGMAVADLGGGRRTKGDTIDHGVGLIVHYKLGDLVQKGTPLFTVHANDEDRLTAAQERVLAAHTLGDDPVPRPPLFYRRIAQ
ncbi:MAG: thymidine phosphorylase [Anaerolineales bacterium]|nr:MAG: thymidine phosphorylase [Anaerolineales bacterium]